MFVNLMVEKYRGAKLHLEPPPMVADCAHIYTKPHKY